MKINKWFTVPKMAFAAIFMFTMVGTAQASFVLGPTSSSFDGSTPGKWGAATVGTGANVTYSFMGNGLATNTLHGSGTSVDLNSFMPGGFQAEIQAAFDAWSAVANITFTQVTDPNVDWAHPSAANVDIRISGQALDGAGGALASANFAPLNAGSAAGDIVFDTAENWKIGFGGAGYDIFKVALHEIGHAIGFDHTAPGVLSVMDAFYNENFRTLQATDIAGGQYLYGVPAAAVPEPGTGLLMLLGMISLLASMRRRRV